MIGSFLAKMKTTQLVNYTESGGMLCDLITVLSTVVIYSCAEQDSDGTA